MNQQVSTNVSGGVLSLGYTQEQVDTIKDTVARGATHTELFMFLSLAKKYELDPFAKEIWFIKDKQGKPMIQVAKDGFLKTAQNNPKFLGIQEGAVYENEIFEIDYENCKVLHKPLLKNRGALVGAWCRVKKEGIDPYIAWAEFAEYGRGKPNYGPWKDLPSVMIKKVATTIALRATFGINGVYAPEEVEENVGHMVEAKVEKQPTKKATAPKATPIKKEEAVEVEAEEVKEPTVDLATPAQITMIHTLWNDISKLKEWSGEESEEQYRKNIEAVCKVQSSKELSMQKASLYIDYLTKSLDKLTPKKEMTAEEVEAFINE